MISGIQIIRLPAVRSTPLASSRKKESNTRKKERKPYRIFVSHQNSESKLSGLKESLNGPLVAQSSLLTGLEGNSITVGGELFGFLLGRGKEKFKKEKKKERKIPKIPVAK